MNERYKQLLVRLQLDNFDKLWAKKIDWFEEPNKKRGDWSGAGHLVLYAEHDVLDIFVKKQQNYARRTIKHPLQGESTFRREYASLMFLQKHNINAAKVVFYDEKNIGGNRCAILATETLKDYEPLDNLLARDFFDNSLPRAQRRVLIKAVASFLRRFHATGMQHRALLPKHIFIKDAGSVPDVALIDLEKARFGLILLRRAYFDLAQLNRHAAYLSRTERLYFLLQYLGHTRLTWFTKRFCQKLLERNRRKNSS